MLARYAADVEYLMPLDEDDLKRAVEEGSKDPPIAGREINHNPEITPYRYGGEEEWKVTR